MQELIKVNFDSENPTVSGRDLHKALEIETRYNDWFKRMCEYGFEENKDFYSFLSKTEESGGRPATDHQLTIPMAKEICMIQRNERGKQFRQYFITIENQWNTPEAVMSRALKLADRQIKQLAVQISALTVENQIMKPKAEYFDELVDRNLLTNFRETAKELKVSEKKLIDYLLKNKYLYRDQKGKLTPYAKKNKGYFEVKESVNQRSGWVGVQTLITVKGKELLKKLVAEVK